MTVFPEAKDRTEYRLTFATTKPRDFYPGLITGPDIPDANGEGRSPGDWCGEEPPVESADIEQWLGHFAHMAVSEAVHEALEWLRVDGERWLDPHGPFELMIQSATDKLCKELATLRAQSLAHQPPPMTMPADDDTDDASGQLDSAEN